MIEVHYFKVLDATTNKWVIQPFKCSEKRILELKGKLWAVLWKLLLALPSTRMAATTRNNLTILLRERQEIETSGLKYQAQEEFQPIKGYGPRRASFGGHGR